LPLRKGEKILKHLPDQPYNMTEIKRNSE